MPVEPEINRLAVWVDVHKRLGGELADAVRAAGHVVAGNPGSADVSMHANASFRGAPTTLSVSAEIPGSNVHEYILRVPVTDSLANAVGSILDYIADSRRFTPTAASIPATAEDRRFNIRSDPQTIYLLRGAPIPGWVTGGWAWDKEAAEVVVSPEWFDGRLRFHVAVRSDGSESDVSSGSTDTWLAVPELVARMLPTVDDRVRDPANDPVSQVDWELPIEKLTGNGMRLFEAEAEPLLTAAERFIADARHSDPRLPAVEAYRRTLRDHLFLPTPNSKLLGIVANELIDLLKPDPLTHQGIADALMSCGVDQDEASESALEILEVLACFGRAVYAKPDQDADAARATGEALANTGTAQRVLEGAVGNTMGTVLGQWIEQHPEALPTAAKAAGGAATYAAGASGQPPSLITDLITYLRVAAAWLTARYPHLQQ